MKTVVKWMGIVIAGIAIGVGSLYGIVRNMSDLAYVTNGPWSTSLTIGSREAGPYLRLSIALGGLLALHRDEAIYYNAVTDSAGELLDGRCSYQVRGRALPARWWSITVYGADHYMISNKDNVYSISPSNIVTADDGSFNFVVGPERNGANWVSTGNAEQFALTLRLYNAGKEVAADPAGIELPSIVKESCQ